MEYEQYNVYHTIQTESGNTIQVLRFTHSDMLNYDYFAKHFRPASATAFLFASAIRYNGRKFSIEKPPKEVDQYADQIASAVIEMFEIVRMTLTSN
jgi:hypothetical protein